MNPHSRILSILVAFGVIGCASSPPTLPPEPLQASLRQPCPILPDLTQPDSRSVFLWSRSLIRAYNECADLHDRTVQAVSP